MTKEEIIQYLKENNIDFDETLHVAKLKKLMENHQKYQATLVQNSDEFDNQQDLDNVKKQIAESKKIIPPAVLKASQVDNEVELARREAERLIRVRITCMNPAKSDYSAIIQGAANSLTSLTRTIPLDTPWHVPNIILEVLKDKTFTTFKTVNVDGKEIKESVQSNEYAIEYLPPLSNEELQNIKISQSTRKE